AFLAGERELLHQRIDAGRAAAGGAQAGDEVVGEAVNRFAQGLGEAGGVDQGRDAGGFGDAPGGVDRAPERTARRRRHCGRGSVGGRHAGGVRQGVRGHGR
ncbi:hypothetical protein RZS08_43800, partial [Arthrospira platensis SPKY1]|nr:hypothetical protein [Arthrospira platensis SPKY1]